MLILTMILAGVVWGCIVRDMYRIISAMGDEQSSMGPDNYREAYDFCADCYNRVLVEELHQHDGVCESCYAYYREVLRIDNL